MGARSGNNYLSTLKKHGAEVWFEGVRVPNVTAHEVLGSRARSIASLYDLQMEKPEAMTFRTSDGGRAGMSFIQAHIADAVSKRGRMLKIWADYSCGTMMDSPATANIALAAMSAASAFFAENDPRHGQNIENYYREACNRDWCTSIALEGIEGPSPPLRVREQARDGLVVEGQSGTGSLGPICEELLVLPVNKGRRDASAPCFPSAFAVPSSAKGLKFIAQRPSSRLAEPACIVVFENVLVPWSRVFLHEDTARADVLLPVTGTDIQLYHQDAVRTLANAEFMVGLAALINEGAATTSEAMAAALAEMIAVAQKMQADIRRAEGKAAGNQWRILAPAPGAFERCAAQAARVQSLLAEIVRLANPSSATSISSADAGANLEIALELARSAAASPPDASGHDASVQSIVERAREFIARLG